MLIKDPDYLPTPTFPTSFREALVLAYQENPCAVLPNALWKTLKTIEDYDTSYTADQNLVTRLKISKENKLMLCWHRNHSLSMISDENINKLDFALLHQDHIENFATNKFDHTQYFRLIHQLEDIPTLMPAPGFSVQIANPLEESIQIADLINQSYLNTNIKPDAVIGWSEQPVYLPELWIWVIDNSNGKPAGLGIAEFDSTIREGSFEWIQVMPEYRGLGLGKWMCTELLLRLKKMADFTTVSGQLHNDTRPDILYRKVGFRGDDIWWVLRRKK